MKLSIRTKIFLGFLTMLLLMIASSFYAVLNLRDLNNYTHRIIRDNVVVVEDSKALIDNLVDRESAFMKFVVLKDDAFAAAFWNKTASFRAKLEEVKSRDLGNRQLLEHIAALNDEYEAFCRQVQAKKETLKLVNLDVQIQQKSRSFVERIAVEIKRMQYASQDDTEKQMAAINKLSKRTLNVTLALFAFALLSGIGFSALLAHSISHPLRRLERAAFLVGQGEFEQNIEINSNDEIGALAKAFAKMMEKLKVLEAVSLDASPLTGLPGNLAIEREVKKRLLNGQHFALCHVDLDNFKPFVDKYGYAWGSEVIKEIANILQNRIKPSANEDVFIGHIGGDDFVIIAAVEEAERICRLLVQSFAPNLNSFYSEEDRQRGYIISKDRKGKEGRFPLITVTIAMVTSMDKKFQDPLDMAKTAAELKEYGKTLEGSNYVRLDDYQAAHANTKPTEIIADA